MSRSVAPSTSPFEPVPGSVVLARAGVWRPAGLARHMNVLLAEHGTGYIRLFPDGQTSSKGARWSHLEIDIPVDTGGTGYLILKETS